MTASAAAASSSPKTGPVEKSVEDAEKALNSTPLFMRELPAAGEMDEYLSTQMDALQSLLYDGDAEEQAQNFKEQGNDNHKSKRFKEAISFYTQGLGNLSAPELREETKRTLWCNRAASHLELGNYGACLRDCALVLEPSEREIPDDEMQLHNNTSLKALFRSFKALVALERLDEAKDVLLRWRSLGGLPDSAMLKQEQALEEKISYRDKMRSESNERQRRQDLSDERLFQALKATGLVLPPKWTPASARTTSPPEVNPPHFDPEYLPVASTSQVAISRPQDWSPPPLDTPLIFPVFFLRPLATPPTRDLILTFRQDVTFGGQLDAFNAQNNVQAQQREKHGEVVYAATKQGRLLKVGRNLTLKQIIAACVKDNDGLELAGGWSLEFYIVTSGGEAERNWIKEMKAQASR